MSARPPKRQRRSTGDEKESQGDRVSARSTHDSIAHPVTLSSRPKPPRARPTRAPTTRNPSSSPSSSPRKGSVSPNATKSKSLHSFFQPATDGQRWSSQKFETKRPLAPVTETTFDVDEIEDDYDSYDEIFTQHLASLDATPASDAASQGSSQTRRPAPKPAAKTRPKSQPTKRFIMNPGPKVSVDQPRPRQSSTETDPRPWAQRFAPSSLEELAVHKKKVGDVRNWLEEAFSGRRRQRLLVLRGPAGAGKTTTLSLLSDSLEFDIVEWRNPAVSEFTAREYVSVGAQFEEFLGRGDRFGGLDLEDAEESVDKPALSPRNRRILLIEEFPAVLNRNSSSLAAFRASIQCYLAAAADDAMGEWMHPPIVMIISETLLSSASSISDNLTVHRLLGPNLYNHPSTSIIDFNSIAPTFMQKALRSILEKEARMSQRARIPGAAILDSISEIGDIRSAVSTLEFLCLKGDQTGNWSGSISKTKKSRDSALTPVEQESLRMISQREASLGMFHAVGKIVYNKRLDPSLMAGDIAIPAAPPDHLSHHRRVKVSQVAVDDLMDETGTDISTFICALHENYPPSCDGNDFTDSLDACIEALSDSDLLGADRRPMQGARAGVGIGSSPFNAGVDVLRQDEISFQVAARGLLFALPYPVNRRVGPGDGRGRPGNAHKMLYPSSLRLWRKTEEIEGLVDSWAKHLLDPFSNPHLASHGTRGSSDTTGVTAWRSLRLGHYASAKGTVNDSSPGSTTMMSRHDLLLHQLPYMAQIRRNHADGWQLSRMTQIRGSRLDDVDDDEFLPPNQTNHEISGPEPDQEKLILSDDDIVDE
ncbi:hypothetical protein N7492_007866 [Penicillium capsulatum]|uniref:Checkpoint protein RAD24-like helical bundle domain-containing protein n=1 Tax=Penicillium capsulatum TaxID=69766 RepID=A0A9W9I213_9EURO|nr:hypothetical protein N7492_007866 [Penicillium capsulatum]KAJ6117697.1 hypothetical protein N7512_007422 [Penicillium capsulatum]